MERDTEQAATIDLGAASSQTHGAVGIFNDETLKQNAPGLSND